MCFWHCHGNGDCPPLLSSSPGSGNPWACGEPGEGMVGEQTPSSGTQGILPGTILGLYNPEARPLSCLLPPLLNPRLAIWAQAASKFALNRQIWSSREAVQGSVKGLHVASQNQLFTPKVSIQRELCRRGQSWFPHCALEPGSLVHVPMPCIGHQARY